jgi:hypothetical protein
VLFKLATLLGMNVNYKFNMKIWVQVSYSNIYLRLEKEHTNYFGNLIETRLHDSITCYFARPTNISPLTVANILHFLIDFSVFLN